MQKTLLRLEHRDKLDALVEHLLKHETLSKETVDKILKDATRPAD